MSKAKKITVEEATKIHQEHASLPMQQVTIAYKGQWYDIRGMTKLEINSLIENLIGEKVTAKNQQHINITL